MEPLDQVINPLLRDALWFALILFGYWAIGFEASVIILLAIIAKRLK